MNKCWAGFYVAKPNGWNFIYGSVKLTLVDTNINPFNSMLIIEAN